MASWKAGFMLFKSHRNEVCRQMDILDFMSHFLPLGQFLKKKSTKNRQNRHEFEAQDNFRPHRWKAL